MLCVLTSWDFNFCVRSSPLRGVETDSSAHLDKRSKQHHVILNSQLDIHIPKEFHPCFRKQHGHVLCLHQLGTWTTRQPV